MVVPFLSNKRLFTLGLRKLLLCFFVCVALIPILFLGTWVYNNALNAEIQSVEQKHLLLAENISGTLGNYANDLKAVFIAKSEDEPAPASPEIEALLRSVNINLLALEREGEGTSLMYCLGDEQLLPLGGIDALKTERRKAFAQPNRVIISPIIFNRRELPTIYLLRVKRDQTLAIAAINTAYFHQVQRAIVFSDSGHAAIVDQAGHAIAHPKPEWERSAHNMSKLAPISLMMAAQAKGVTRFYSPAMQADMIVGYATVPETGWGVIIPQPYSEIQARARKTKLIALLVSGVGLALAFFVSWRLTIYILRPIHSVIEASRALGAGYKIESLGLARRRMPKELHILLHTFDQMAAEVSSARTTLEERVIARTQALQKEVERRKALEAQLIRQATHDVLTGLPNRRLLEQQLREATDFSVRSHQPIALLFIDLDGFKSVNDRYGHKLGDHLLVQVSARLRHNLRKTDSVFRLGGDEFVVLLKQAKSAESVSNIANHLLYVLKQPFSIQSYEVHIGASIGMRISHSWSRESAEDILSDADSAMYKAKEKGNCSMLYEEISA
ncbi:MAG: diguanylate cyclase [Cyanobacteria bacterium J06643_4]